MEKKPFVTLEQLKEIEKTYPTPYHIYDEKGFMENARKVNPPARLSFPFGSHGDPEGD